MRKNMNSFQDSKNTYCENMLSAEDRIIRAKISLQKTNPFFAYLVLHLKQKENGVQSMGIDINGNLHYNKEFVDALSDDDIILCLVHEILHIFLMHLLRRGNRNKTLWNISTDLITNKIIELNFRTFDNSIIKKGGLTEENLNTNFNIEIPNLENKTAEEIYEILKDYYEKRRDFKEFVDKYSFDVHYDLDSLTEEEKRKLEQKYGKSFEEVKKEIEKEIRKELVEAYQFSKLKGIKPLGLERFFDKLLDFKLNWKDLLHKYITQEIPYDYSWKKPSKKSITTGIYLPTSIKENLNVVCVVDLSGSIAQKELNEFMSEIINIAKSFNNINITVLTHDVEVQDVIEINNGNIDRLMNIKIHGFGGTSHLWLPKYLRENFPNTKLLICFTDGYSEFPEEEELRNIKTIWVVSKNGNPEQIPFGYKIRLE